MKAHLALLLYTLLPGLSAAATSAITADGKPVILHDDNTWEYVDTESQQDGNRAVLSVARVTSSIKRCRIGLKLQNDLPDHIRSLVPRVSAYLDNQVRFDTKSVGFAQIKPSRDQYQEVIFHGVECDDIKYLEVHGADRCEVGELNKFSIGKGMCLALIRLIPSDKITVVKQAPAPEEPPMEPETDLEMPLDPTESPEM